MKYKTKDEIYQKALNLVDTKFSDYDINNRLIDSNNKGAFGHIIEEGFFEYKVNSNPEPDFKEVGLELKVTPFLQNKNKSFSSKERLVLNIIDFMNENLFDFYESSFWKKNQNLLIVFYLYKISVLAKDLEIAHILMWDYSPEDLKIIKYDWNRIVSKIKLGKAHEISEGDTLYLGACRKGNKDTKKVKQPFSNILAHKRAYSLKQGYMTQILREHVLNKKCVRESILQNYEILKEQSFEEYLESILKRYYGRKVSELCVEFGVNPISKQKNQLIISKIFKLKGSITNTSEYVKGGYKLKTLKIEESGSLKESMSFPHFSFLDIIQEDWESSTIRDMLYETRFMFVAFKGDSNNDAILSKVVFHSLSEDDLDTHVKSVFEKTKKVIVSGNIVKKITVEGEYLNNFPKASDNPVSHIRPHGKNREDTLPLPVVDKLTGKTKYTKMCFWLNSKYIKTIINR